jgi:ATP phosphoribosyltransferase regulatory subunit
MDKYKLPEGLRDYLPEDCIRKTAIHDKIMKVFKSHGYLRIDTPTLEYYKLYSQGIGRVDEEYLFKVSDIDGRLLVLRPDITMPVSRVISTKVKPERPVKYCYLGNSYTIKQDNTYRLREFTQAGVELINEPSAYADAEVICLAIKALLAANLTDFMIDIGQVGFFKGIINSLGIDEDGKSAIAERIYKKDIIGLIDLLNNKDKLNGNKPYKSIDRSLIKLLTKLPSVFGGIEMLDAAEAYDLPDESLNALDNLRQVYELIKIRGYSDYISFDLSLVNSMNYYSGIVFKGITKHFGAPVLAGGRYDKLTATFKEYYPATGFAIGVDNLYTALSRADKLPAVDSIDYLIGYDDMGYDSAVKAADNLISEGYIVETALVKSKDALIEFAKDRTVKYKKLIFIGEKDGE